MVRRDARSTTPPAESCDAELAARVELGLMLAEARRAHHLTQPALSRATGIQQAEISRIERGIGNPTAATLTRLASALGQKIVLAPAASWPTWVRDVPPPTNGTIRPRL